MKLESITQATDGKHKYQAVFLQDNGRTKTTKFGAKGYTDYLHSKDKEQRERYLKRHAGMGEHWNQPTTAGSLAKNILWGNSTSFAKNVADFKKKFDL